MKRLALPSSAYLDPDGSRSVRGIANDNKIATILTPPADDDNPHAEIPHDPDALLIQRAGQGDQLACGMIVDRHLNRLFGFAHRILQDQGEAEDVVQETFLRLWRHAGDWTDRGAKVTTWLHQIALNLCRDRLRRKPTASLDEALEQPSPEPGPHDALQKQEVSELVRTAINRLPERQREAILLCHYQELGNIEAAALLNISVEALESLLARGRRALRQQLAAARSDLMGEVE